MVSYFEVHTKSKDEGGIWVEEICQIQNTSPEDVHKGVYDIFLLPHTSVNDDFTGPKLQNRVNRYILFCLM